MNKTKPAWADHMFTPWELDKKLMLSGKRIWAEAHKWNNNAQLNEIEWASLSIKYSPQELNKMGFQIPFRPKVFVQSEIDIFDYNLSDELRNKLFSLIKKHRILTG